MWALTWHEAQSRARHSCPPRESILHGRAYLGPQSPGTSVHLCGGSEAPKTEISKACLWGKSQLHRNAQDRVAWDTGVGVNYNVGGLTPQEIRLFPFLNPFMPYNMHRRCSPL